MRTETMSANRLARESSPYLLQHADNPVDWYPWGEEALELARREGKPILLSIGYSACHWCHVMAHESFEDAATAGVMNDLFVNVKVDREERPDLDKIYQTAHYMLTQRSGGWPLTMFLTPEDHVPFFGGTYFPPEPRHGLPAFKDLCARVAEAHREQGEAIAQQNLSLVAALGSLWGPREAEGRLAGAATLQAAREQLAESFDARFGGFGDAPKFPHPSSLERLLRQWALDGESANDPGLHMVRHTLDRMAAGGIYDHLGGGFCRYSVDAYWMIPHFEKMLYDNGPLLGLYAQLAALTGETDPTEVACETADWVIREMQSPQGGYYSTLDADSEGEEGRFYVWTREAVQQRLDEPTYALFAARFGLDREANFEGRWHLHAYRSVPELAAATDHDEAELRDRLAQARRRLFEVRSERVHPGRDEKILTAWNALMIRGMALAARHLDRPRYAESAGRALDFIREQMWRNGRLLASYKDGKARHPAYLDDYAFLIDATLELLQLRWRADELAFAQALAEVLLEHFEDREHGGFFFTADDHEQLIQRPKPLADEALPSGNGVAALALQRLGLLLGEPRYLEAAERCIQFAGALMARAPAAHCALLNAYEEQLQPTQTLILRGAGEALARWQAECARPYAPRRQVYAIPSNAKPLPEALAEKTPRGEVVAYVCTGMTCGAPLDRLDALQAVLHETNVSLR
jgi:uncharacterized protein YyaL (SSP411 family)